MTENPRRKALTIRQNDAVAIVKEQKGALATFGVDPVWFSRVLQEAFIRNPDIVTAKRKDLANAVRDCCKDGLIPDGQQAAIIVKGGGSVTYLPMVGGRKIMAYRAIKAHITHDHICANDTYTLTKVPGDIPKLAHTPAPLDEEPGEVIGSWAMMELPDGTKYFKIMRKKELEAARSKSNARKGDRPWVLFPGPMAEKSAVNSLIEANRHLFPDTEIANAFAKSLDRDSDFGDEGIEAVDMVEVEEGEFEVADEQAGEAESQPAEAAPAGEEPLGEEIAKEEPKPQPTRQPQAKQDPPAEQGKPPSIDPIVLTHHVKMEPFVFPESKADGTAYQVLPKIPDGLHFQVNNRTMWGSPRVVQEAKEYKYLVLIEGVEKARIPFTIEVQPNPESQPAKPTTAPPPDDDSGEPNPGWLW